MTVSVAIDLALDRLFTYEVPEALRKKLAVGQLLSVPFGHREARGFAMAIGTEGDVRLETEDLTGLASQVAGQTSGRSYSLKPVTAIVDETPFFSEKLLELVKRVAAYTAAPLESVLKAALPAAVLKKNAKAKEQLYVDCSIGGLADCPIAEKGLTQRQKWLVENIERLGGGWMQQLCHELQTTPTSIRALAAKGLVTVEVRAKRRDPLGGRRVLPSKPWPLNEGQRKALEIVSAPRREDAPGTVLLFGVTGSGKTEVYLQAIARELEAGRGAIVMVPEISLTPQTVQRFASRFGDRVAVLHSALSDGERYDEWHRIRSGAARVVVGPRSAVWAPVRDLGLIVVDEEHEASYKQEDNPRYHARDVAVLRGAIEGARVVLGSATPSLESWMNVKRGKYALAEMKCRAGSGRLPAVNIVDMRLGPKGAGALFSPELLEAIRLRLDRNEQTILFLNRRGYSRSLVCEACGHVMSCPSCSLVDKPMSYTYHRAGECLRCHVCGGWIPVPEKCPECHAAAFSYRGIGTQRAEAALGKCFPRARILRMDADSTSRRHSHDDILGAFRRQEADILVGTQMIAKGLDFPNVTLVGVLNADSSLNMPDFRAAERTFQLLAQVSGRAGRAELPGEVFIQTYDPEVPVIRAAKTGDYVGFAEGELRDRREAGFPPYSHLAAVNFSGTDPGLVESWSGMYAASLRKVPGLEVSEAMPSALERVEGRYRWQVVVRALSAGTIAKAWRWISGVRPAPKNLRVSLDIDAYNLV